MRLLALRAETMQAMRRLKLPCDDITPIGLWGSDMFLIGVNNEQFEVLRLWNVQTEDITPATLRDFQTESPAVPTTPSAGKAASDARVTATETSRETAPSSASRVTPVSPRPSPSAWAAEAADSAPTPPRVTSARSHDTPASSPAVSGVASSAVDAAAGEPAADNGTANSSANGAADAELKSAAPKEKQESSAGKLRMTVDGEHLYAEIRGGKIVLKDRTYDSLAHARDSIRRERNKVAVWEYFDEGVKSWRVLN